MKLKKQYKSPSIEIIRLDSVSILQTSTGAEIPDSGWGSRHVSDDVVDEEEFSNLIGILSILQQ